MRFSTDGTMTARGFSIAYVAVDPYDSDGDGLNVGGNGDGDSYSDEELSTPFPGSLRRMYVSARSSSGSYSAEERTGLGYGRAGFDNIFGAAQPLIYGGVGGTGDNSGSSSSGGPDQDADSENASVDVDTEDEEDYNDFVRFKQKVEERPANRLSEELFD